MFTTMRCHARCWAVAPVLLLASACSRGADSRTDTSGTTASATATSGAAMDTGMAGHDMAGMNHAAMSNRPAPRDSNQSFLRMMSDHHQGLVAMSDTAMAKLGTTAQADARKLRTDQKSEQTDMLQMLRREYSDSVTPMIMPSNQAMIAAVARAGAGDADRVYYQQVVAHHREGIQMIDRMLEQLTGTTKRMASTTREKQQREIAEFERKASGSS